MKLALLALLQSVVFFALFVLGSFAHPFHLQWFVTQLNSHSTRYFIPDGLLLAVALFLVLVVVQFLRKRIRSGTPVTAIAFALAIICGLALRLGFVTRGF